MPGPSQNSLLESEMRFKDGQTHDYAPVIVGFAKAVEASAECKAISRKQQTATVSEH